MSYVRYEPPMGFRVFCNCGVKDILVSIPYSSDVVDLTEAAEDEAEKQGWGSHGFCPACQKAMDKDVAECNAAVAANMVRQLGFDDEN